MIIALLTIISVILAGLFGYSLYVLRLLRNELKDKTRALNMMRMYRGGTE